MRTGQILHNPMIRSQPFSGPGLLGCDFHKSFLVFCLFSFLFGLEGHEVGYFPSSRLVEL